MSTSLPKSDAQKDWEVFPVLKDSKYYRAFSPTNIALAKYWGKRDLNLNLPTNSSISATLKDFGSFTTVEFNSSFTEDSLFLNGKEASANSLKKVVKVLDLVRHYSGQKIFARVQSKNNFPTAAGLASSASGLSALAFAAVHAIGLDVSLAKVSEIARQGSGSACRSLFNGFVEWKRGEQANGSDSTAVSFATADSFPLEVTIAVSNHHEKDEASTNGMEVTKQTSPYFEAWVENAQLQALQIKQAILAKDFNLLANLVETNCIRMHTSAMAANPPIVYWQPETLAVMKKVWSMRKKGINAFFTIDAGPNVVVFHESKFKNEVTEELKKIPGIDLLHTTLKGVN